MFLRFSSTNFRERKLRICDRNREFAHRNRRPIADVIEFKLKALEDATEAALHEQDDDIFRGLFSFSRFHS